MSFTVTAVSPPAHHLGYRAQAGWIQRFTPLWDSPCLSKYPSRHYPRQIKHCSFTRDLHFFHDIFIQNKYWEPRLNKPYAASDLVRASEDTLVTNSLALFFKCEPHNKPLSSRYCRLQMLSYQSSSLKAVLSESWTKSRACIFQWWHVRAKHCPLKIFLWSSTYALLYLSDLIGGWS